MKSQEKKKKEKESKKKLKSSHKTFVSVWRGKLISIPVDRDFGELETVRVKY